jgi:hypothetical protein
LEVQGQRGSISQDGRVRKLPPPRFHFLFLEPSVPSLVLFPPLYIPITFLSNLHYKIYYLINDASLVMIAARDPRAPSAARSPMPPRRPPPSPSLPGRRPLLPPHPSTPRPSRPCTTVRSSRRDEARRLALVLDELPRLATLPDFNGFVYCFKEISALDVVSGVLGAGSAADCSMLTHLLVC